MDSLKVATSRVRAVLLRKEPVIRGKVGPFLQNLTHTCRVQVLFLSEENLDSWLGLVSDDGRKKGEEGVLIFVWSDGVVAQLHDGMIR